MAYQLNPVAADERGHFMPASQPARPLPAHQTQSEPRTRGRIETFPNPTPGDPTGGPAGALWREQVDGPSTYPRVSIDRDVTITMTDGVALRATVIRPANRFGQTVQTPYPAIVNINPYNRAALDFIDQTLHAPLLGKAVHAASGAVDGSGTPLEGLTRLTGVVGGGALDVFGINRNLVRSGYVQIIVDVRGTGSSHGKWEILGPREQQDSVEVLEWVAEQPWCDGNLGLAGWSYSAINSLQAADKRPAGLGAVFAVEGCDDIVRDIYITGGMPSAFIPIWLSAVNILKWLPNPSTVLRDVVRGSTVRWATDRIKSPATELPSLLWGFLTARDDRIFDDPYFHERDPEIAQITAPTFTVGAWHDLFGRSATGVYERLAMEPGRKQMIVADGYHLDVGFGHGRESAPPRLDVLERAWFDRWLKGHRNGIDAYGPVTMQQQGGDWISEDVFPRPESTPQRLYLSARSSNSASHATHDGSLTGRPVGEVSSLEVRPDLRGAMSRDMVQVTAGAAMVLGRGFTTDARFQERGALSFSTEPVTVPTRISGAMNLRLNVATTGHEGVWAVTVNDVAPDGTSSVLSNGALSMSNRAIDPDRSVYADDGSLLVAHHFLSRTRKLPVPADTPVRIDVDLVPTDAVLKPGHRLRVDVYAASFPRYLTVVPDLIRARGRRQRLVLDPRRPSHLTIQADAALVDVDSPTTEIADSVR